MGICSVLISGQLFIVYIEVRICHSLSNVNFWGVFYTSCDVRCGLVLLRIPDSGDNLKLEQVLITPDKCFGEALDHFFLGIYSA